MISVRETFIYNITQVDNFEFFFGMFLMFDVWPWRLLAGIK